MLQRIQTLYFLSAAVLCIVCACVKVGRFVLPDGSVAEWGNGGYWPLMALLVCVALLLLCALMLYRHRMLQVRLGVFSCLLLVGWYALYFWHGYYTHSVLYADCNYVAGLSFAPNWTAALPCVAVVLAIAGVRAVLRDEMLIRSLDRLR